MSSGAGPDPWKIYRIRIQQNYADPSDPDPQQKFQVYSIQYIKCSDLTDLFYTH